MIKTKNFICTALAVAITSSALTGCAPSLGGSDYAIAGVGEAAKTLPGVIVSARPVLLNSGKRSGDDAEVNAGGVIGAGAGALAGSQVGGGRGRYVTGALGALAGGFAGQMVEKNLKTQKGMEYQVRLDRGDIITLAQGAEPAMAPGQRVYVVMSNRDRSRIVPAH